MVNWVDEIPEVVQGTPVNRLRLMAMQGMEQSQTVFNADGTIAETYVDGVVLTTFNPDGTITQRFTATNGMTIAKTTIFNDDGSIAEEVGE